MDKRILCFGDSLTWGWVPIEAGVPTTRYAPDQRWTGILQTELKNDFVVIEEGLSGRTTAVDDPIDPRLNGSAYLPAALASHFPLDLVIIMLGTNDTKAYFDRTPTQITAGLTKLITQVASSTGGVGTVYPAPQVLLVAPPPLGKMPDPHFDLLFEGGQKKTEKFAKIYEELADFLKVHFLNAGDFISTDGVDGIHFTPENNRDLAGAIAQKVRAIFA